MWGHDSVWSYSCHPWRPPQGRQLLTPPHTPSYQASLPTCEECISRVQAANDSFGQDEFIFFWIEYFQNSNFCAMADDVDVCNEVNILNIFKLFFSDTTSACTCLTLSTFPQAIVSVLPLALPLVAAQGTQHVQAFCAEWAGC